MNNLRIFRYLYSKSWIAEIILVFQLICMFLFSYLILNPISEYLRDKKEVESVYKIDLDEIIHFNNTLFRMESLTEKEIEVNANVYDIISNTEGIGTVFSYGAETGFFTCDGKNANARLYLYSKELTESIRLPLELGCLTDKEGDTIPIIISSSMTDRYNIGSIIEIETSAITNLRCIVTGVIKNDTPIAAINGYGSFPDLSAVANFSRLIRSEDHVIIYNADQEMINRVEDVNFMVIPEKNADRDLIISTLDKTLSNYGTLAQYDEMKSWGFKQVFNGFYIRIVLFILLFLIAVFGYGGYMYLTIRRKQRELSIFYIYGMSRLRMAVIIFVSNALLLFVAFISSKYLYPWFATKIIDTEIVPPGSLVYVGCAVCLLIVMIVGMASAYSKNITGTEMSLLKEGE